MNALTRIVGLRLASDRAAGRLVQLGSYVAGPVVLILAVKALTRLGASEVELVIGLLAAGALAVGMICLGTVTAIYEEVRRR